MNNTEHSPSRAPVPAVARFAWLSPFLRCPGSSALSSPLSRPALPALLAASALAFLAFPAAATAQEIGPHSFSTDFGSPGPAAGQLAGPQDVAVDDSTGDVYVADTANHRIDQFSSSGAFLRAWGWEVDAERPEAELQVCTEATGCQAGTPGSAPGQFDTPTFVEVDNSTGPSAGDVYVADTADGIVQKFDPSGSLVSSWGSGGAIDFSEGGTIGGIAVDGAGDLFVLTDDEPYDWTEIGQGGALVEKISTSSSAAFRHGEPSSASLGPEPPSGRGIAIDPSQTFYEAQQGAVVKARVLAPVIGQDFNGFAVGKGTPTGLAVDPLTDDVYVDQGDVIQHFATAAPCNPYASCLPTDSFGAGDLSSAAGLAIDPASGTLYAADTGGDDVAVFAPLPLPALTTGPVADLAPTSATLTGHVEPAAAGAISECRFEYIDASNQADEVQSLAPSGATGGTFTLTFEGQTTPPIPYNASAGLIENYLASLSTIGSNNVRVSQGSLGGPYEVEFTGSLADTDVPQLSADASSLTPSGASLAPATTTEGYGWSSATAVPCSPSPTLDGPTEVSAQLTGLVPFDSYGYRLVLTAADDLGYLSYGGDRTFTTTPGLAPAIDATSSTGLTPTTADLTAEIDPNLLPTTYRFEYGTEPTYGSKTLAGESIGEDDLDHSASALISGLTPGTAYHFRVLAINFSGVTDGPDRTFDTPDLPTIAAATASDLGQTTATLSATIKPGFRPTTYRFEYGVTAAYGSSTSESPSIGSDDSAHAAAASLTGLAPATTYHYRVVATNEIGVADSPGQTFTTAPAAEVKLPPPPACKKGFVRKHGKCVKKVRHERHKGKHNHRAKKHRKGSVRP